MEAELASELGLHFAQCSTVRQSLEFNALRKGRGVRRRTAEAGRERPSKGGMHQPREAATTVIPAIGEHRITKNSARIPGAGCPEKTLCGY